MDAAISRLLAAAAAGKEAQVERDKLVRAAVPVHLYQLGISSVAPSADVARTIVEASTAVNRLDSVSADARALTASLASFSGQAEAAVKRVRQLDGMRQRLQHSLERVEDLIDLQASLSGVQESIDRNDLTSAALHVQRFRSLRRHLPVPDSDVAFMAEAEELLMNQVLKRFDAALAENQESHAAGGGGGDDAAGIAGRISECCRLLSMLGHGDMGLTRYTAYLSQTLDAEYRRDLCTLASAGVDVPASAVNTLSACFARAVNTLSVTLDMAAATFGRWVGPAAVLRVAHGTCDRNAARVLRSVARSARVQAALNAREVLVATSAALGAPTHKHASSSGGGAAGGGGEQEGGISAAEASRLLAQVEDASNAAPFVLPLPGAPTKGSGAAGGKPGPTAFRGGDYTEPGRYDALLDELALILQRCASYARIMQGRALEIDAGAAVAGAADADAVAAAAATGSAGSATVQAGGLAASSTDVGSQPSQLQPSPALLEGQTALEAYRAQRSIRESAGEVGSVYSVLEQGRLLSAVARAIALDELLEDGVAAASVDIVSARALQALEAPPAAPGGGGSGGGPAAAGSGSRAGRGAPGVDGSPAAEEGEAGEDVDFGSGGGLGPAGAGAGAMVSSLVEDAYYVCAVACKRAFATGSADAASAVVNHAVYALTDTLAAELAARLRVAMDDPSAVSGAGGAAGGSPAPGGGSFAAGLSAAAADAGNLFSAALQPAQLERLTALRQSIMSSSPVKLAATKLAELQAIPPSSRDAYMQQLAGSVSGGGRRGDGGGKGSALSSPAPSAGSRGGGMASPAVPGAPMARLTAEVAATSLALNNLQLAAACTLRLRSELEGMTTDIFAGAGAAPAPAAAGTALAAGGAAAAAAALSDRDNAKIRTCIGGLADLHSHLRRSLDAGVSVLLTRLTPRLRTALNVFEGQSSLIQYELTEEAFAAAEEGHNAFSTEFLPVLSSILAPYQYSLTPPLSVHIVLRVAAYVAKQLEPRIRRKRFNLLGGLRFDADLRALVAFFSERSSRRARSRFARLLQMAQLLTSETAADALSLMAGDLSNPGGCGWLLGAEETRAVLAMRTDFSAAEIAQLKA